jgi:CubicO group peptidase (beta-lactamase class C family)
MFAAARGVIAAGLEARAFPAAVIEVGRMDRAIWREAFGQLSYAHDAALCTTDSIFDLASLTKVICTTPLTMRVISDDQLALATPLSRVVSRWRGADRSAVTIRHLLDHSSGLPAHERFWERGLDRAGIEQAICEAPLTSPPGTASVYSDLGFMLLGFLLEDLDGRDLDGQFSALPIAADDLIMFCPPADLLPRIAPTEDDPWRGRVLCGDVHDENAAVLGGVAGHAGLFGTAGAVGGFARTVLRTFREPTWIGTPDLMSQFAQRTAVPGSSRALGWDTMRPTSSCGTLMCPTAIGHTGFTGTSLWIDYEKDLYVAFLTNRVHPTRKNDAHIAIRPRLHDAIVSEFLKSG